MQVGDIVMASKEYSTIGSYGRIKGLVTQILDPGLGWSDQTRRVEVKLISTGGRCVFRSVELEVISAAG